MKEERGRMGGRGREDIRTDADRGERRKNFVGGGGGEILIWRGKRGRRVSPGHVTAVGQRFHVLLHHPVYALLWSIKYLYPCAVSWFSLAPLHANFFKRGFEPAHFGPLLTAHHTQLYSTTGHQRSRRAIVSSDCIFVIPLDPQ